MSLPGCRQSTQLILSWAHSSVLRPGRQGCSKYSAVMCWVQCETHGRTRGKTKPPDTQAQSSAESNPAILVISLFYEMFLTSSNVLAGLHLQITKTFWEEKNHKRIWNIRSFKESLWNQTALCVWVVCCEGKIIFNLGATVLHLCLFLKRQKSYSITLTL